MGGRAGGTAAPPHAGKAGRRGAGPLLRTFSKLRGEGGDQRLTLVQHGCLRHHLAESSLSNPPAVHISAQNQQSAKPIVVVELCMVTCMCVSREYGLT